MHKVHVIETVINTILVHSTLHWHVNLFQTYVAETIFFIGILRLSKKHHAYKRVQLSVECMFMHKIR